MGPLKGPPLLDGLPAAAPAPDTLSPADRYQELFIAVQDGAVFADSKTFVDCIPLSDPRRILADYRDQHLRGGFDLAHFVHSNFAPATPAALGHRPPPGQPIGAHIESLWPVLTRHPAGHPAGSSLLDLPGPYLVPGGRFGELYYWDSYFSMLGLRGAAHRGLLRSMVDNFGYLIDTHGHVPNGTRTYYLGRSQPPVFALMVELAQRRGAARGVEHLPRLLKEHAWWMAGAADTPRGSARRRVVRLPDGRLLNRYWDDRDTPREEAWLEDVTTAQCSPREPAEIYRDLRAACESGWDFSTRWLGAPPPAAGQGGRGRAASAPSLATIRTTDIAPVDLNAFLFKLECKIAELSALDGAAAAAREFGELARRRKGAVLDWMWDESQSAFFDHDWRLGSLRGGHLTAAAAVPLFVGLAEPRHAAGLAGTIARRLLAPGGLSTTEHHSDQQWDRPNGWAPLQWMAIQGLAAYGHRRLSDSIARRWLATVAAIYEREGRLIEKYALRRDERDATEEGRGGEYPLQDGFGWTNGVTAGLLARCPGHSAHGSKADGAGRGVHR